MSTLVMKSHNLLNGNVRGPSTPPTTPPPIGSSTSNPTNYKGPSRDDVLADRKQVMGKNLKINHKEKPLMIVRGLGTYLYDEAGSAYLDCVNNVACVGHCHPKVVEATNNQIAALNTNSRYLHPLMTAYAKRLLATFPKEAGLEVVYFTCSGSEANDLALRMARTYTRRTHAIVQGSAYHGHTQATLDCSPYKFEGKGGTNKTPAHIRQVPCPDEYRGPYPAESTADPGTDYGNCVKAAIDDIEAAGEGVAAFIAESVVACGGVVVPPQGYMRQAFEHVKRAGGVCIADEVQTGFARSGSHFWAFEAQGGCLPDIVTMGKPMGNGYPVAGLVVTRAIAEGLANDNGTVMEYFNTYAGSPAACAAGLAVLDAIRDDGLQRNAEVVGSKILSEFERLRERYACVGDVRGLGLFVGMEIVKDRRTKEPDTELANFLVRHCRENNVLISTDGPSDNVIKLKPPLCFNLHRDVPLLISALEAALKAADAATL